MIMCYDRHTIANNGVLHYVARSATNTHEIGVRFKYHGDGTTARMKLVRSIWQSCSIIVGIATDELNLERNGKVDGMGSLCVGSVFGCTGFGNFSSVSGKYKRQIL